VQPRLLLGFFLDIQIADRQNVDTQTTDYQNVDINITDCQNVAIQTEHTYLGTTVHS
jgi:hypothetical protein